LFIERKMGEVGSVVPVRGVQINPRPRIAKIVIADPETPRDRDRQGRISGGSEMERSSAS
jgi:hypothetical protein